MERNGPEKKSCCSSNYSTTVLESINTNEKVQSRYPNFAPSKHAHLVQEK